MIVDTKWNMVHMRKYFKELTKKAQMEKLIYQYVAPIHLELNEMA